MSATKSPAFQFYPDNFVSGAPAFMKPIETHVYMWLLCLEWTRNGFAYDEASLASWCRVSPSQFRAAWPKVAESFELRDGRYYNARLDMERAKQAEWREKSAKGGRRSGEARSKGGSTTLEPGTGATVEPNANTPFLFLSPTPVTTKQPQPSADEQQVLDRYLMRHPRRRVGPKDAAIVRKALALGYSAADLCEAVDGNAGDPWHVERKKHELAYVLRNNGKIDDFRAKAQEAAQPIVDQYGCLTAYGERVTRP